MRNPLERTFGVGGPDNLERQFMFVFIGSILASALQGLYKTVARKNRSG
jgi:hypothetical protein